jgi:LDH2 family malate/lactate/ureidoglycolate dehydrogenase/phosphoglycerate dehydrogenase-like enzyme
MRPRVVIAYAKPGEAPVEEEILRAAGIEVVLTGELESESARTAAREAEALMVGLNRISADLMDELTRLKIVTRVGTGVDAIDIAAATTRGIWVTNVPDYSIDEVSTHAISLVLAQARMLFPHRVAGRDGRWRYRAETPIRRFAGQTIGVLGMGRIGSASARKGRGLGLEVIAHDPYLPDERFEELGVRRVDFDTLMRESDFLTLHVPLTDETRRIVDARALSLMKPTAYLVNTARGAQDHAPSAPGRSPVRGSTSCRRNRRRPTTQSCTMTGSSLPRTLGGLRWRLGTIPRCAAPKTSSAFSAASDRSTRSTRSIAFPPGRQGEGCLMPILSPETLRDLVRGVLEGVGTPADIAGFVGDSLIDANLAGHDSHGVMRLLLYAETARSGQVDSSARACVTKRSGATAIVDGAFGWGQPAMWYHVGRVAPYVERIAQAGMIGIAMANAGRAVAPYGGRARVMGTNPIAWAAPRGDGKPPLCLDVATAAIAEGKVRVAKSKGEPVPPGVIVTVDGLPSQIPDDFYDGGALLPFGGHKGSGLSILAQVIGRGLAGLQPPSPTALRGANGPFVLAINVESFAPFEQFLGEVEAQCEEISGSAPAEGFDRVRLPGEPELENRERRGAEGIPIPDSTWGELVALAVELGVHDARWSA